MAATEEQIDEVARACVDELPNLPEGIRYVYTDAELEFSLDSYGYDSDADSIEALSEAIEHMAFIRFA
jgi:hypothetical protein